MITFFFLFADANVYLCHYSQGARSSQSTSGVFLITHENFVTPGKRRSQDRSVQGGEDAERAGAGTTFSAEKLTLDRKSRPLLS